MVTLIYTRMKLHVLSSGLTWTPWYVTGRQPYRGGEWGRGRGNRGHALVGMAALSYFSCFLL